MGAEFFKSTTARPYSLADWQAGVFPPHQWDVADACEDGWTRADILKFMKAAVSDTLGEWPETEEAAMDRADDGLRELSARFGDEPSAPPASQGSRDVEVTIDDERRALTGGWVFLTERGVFRHLDTGEEMKVAAFDLRYQRIVPEMDFSPAGTVYAKPKQVTASQWLQWYRLGQSAANDLYLPQQPRVFEMDGKTYVNAYLPGLVPRAAKTWQGHWAAECWQGHLSTVLPGDWPLLLGWLAHNVQHPGAKIAWAPIIKGVPGDGKTSISKMLGSVMGASNVRVVSTEAVFSDFNGFSEGSCVAFLEELRAKGHSRHDVMTKLKPLITNSVIEVVRKGRDGRNVPNTTNYLGFTNHEDALVLDADDRRWAVMFTRFKSRDELVPAGLDRDYFDRLHTAVHDHADVLRAWLLSVDLSSFDAHVAPPTSVAKRIMIANSMSVDAMALAEMIALGREGVAQHAVAVDCLNAAFKAEGQPSLTTSRAPAAFQQLGWRALPSPVKWEGKTRRVYIDASHPWPDDEAALRTAVRDELDSTRRRAAALAEDFPEPDYGGKW